jgi:glycosyltransferase involved in cell wall biosynthesis
VIPTRNRWAFLATAVDVALGQEGVQMEVVVVDDGSTDETPTRLAAMEERRLRVFRHESGRGVARARNRGIQEARGEWVAFLDDDDLWSPRKLRTQLDALASEQALFCYCASVVLDEQKSVVRPDAPIPDPDELPGLLRKGNVVPGGCSNVVVRTRVARELGGFDERLSMLADWDLWLRLADVGRAVACSDVLVAYRKHSRNMTLVDLSHMDHELDYFASKQRADRGMTFDAVAYSRWLAGEAASPAQAARIHLRAARAYRSPSDIGLAMGALLGTRTVKRTAGRVRSAIGTRVRRRRSPALAPGPEWLERYRD